MSDKEKLYETFGELVYVIAKADGVIQTEEIRKLDELLKHHPLAPTIKWSLNYEMGKEPSPDEIYNKVISYCHSYGPAPEYAEFVSILEAVAEASNGIDVKEQEVITSFSRDLTARFKADIERLY